MGSDPLRTALNLLFASFRIILLIALQLCYLRHKLDRHVRKGTSVCIQRFHGAVDFRRQRLQLCRCVAGSLNSDRFSVVSLWRFQ